MADHLTHDPARPLMLSAESRFYLPYLCHSSRSKSGSVIREAGDLNSKPLPDSASAWKQTAVFLPDAARNSTTLGVCRRVILDSIGSSGEGVNGGRVGGPRDQNCRPRVTGYQPEAFHSRGNDTKLFLLSLG